MTYLTVTYLKHLQVIAYSYNVKVLLNYYILLFILISYKISNIIYKYIYYTRVYVNILKIYVHSTYLYLLYMKKMYDFCLCIMYFKAQINIHKYI